jgi:hypothetical protein
MQAYQKHLTLEPQSRYEFRFTARSSTGHDLNVSFLQDVSPYIDYGLTDAAIDLEPTWREYVIHFTTSGFATTVNDGLFRFWFASYATAGDEYMIDNVILRNLSATAVDEGGMNEHPREFALSQNYPNPFNPTTRIGYSVGAVSGQQSVDSRVRLAVYDLLGREVATLVDERKAPGNYEVNFDASGLASGVYLYRLASGESVESRKMVLMK